jgi:hypothetical protein
MLTAENFILFFLAVMGISLLGYKWGVIERQTEITLEESFK